MRERVLITGGGGYIGSVLTPELLSEGYQVTVLDKFSEGNPTLASCCHYAGFRPIRGDVRDEPLMRKLLSQADIVIPLAAIVGVPATERNPIDTVSVNQDAVIFIAKTISRSQRLIYPNTNSSYGAVEDGICTEETPLRPQSLYGSTKAEAEYGVFESGNGVVLRLATVFGMSPRMRIDLLLNDFVHRAITDRAVIVFEGSFNRNFVHVRDVSKAFRHAIAHYKIMNGEAYNVVLPAANLSKLALCKKIQEALPSFTYLEAPIGEDPDKRNCTVSSRKLEETGWRPDWSLERGILELVKGLSMLRNRRFGNV